jgi:lipid-A-disaccharide synthase
MALRRPSKQTKERSKPAALLAKQSLPKSLQKKDAVKTGKGRPLSIFVVAGEASGDVLGAAVLKTLKQQINCTIQGVGGALMEKAGDFKSVLPMHTFSVMGAQILIRLPRLLKAFPRVRRALAASRTDILLTFDAPELSFRLAKKAPKGIRRIHCTAPSVWAWRPGRAAKIAKFLDRLCVLFPFEPPYFEKHGLKTTFVGHPRAFEPQPSKDGFWKMLHTDTQEVFPQKRLLLLMPGSRQQEIKMLWPLFRKVAMAAETATSDLTVAVLVAPGRRAQLKAMPLHWIALESPEEHAKAMRAGTCALVASGTATLELGISGCPMVVAYKVAGVLGVVLRRLLQTPFVSLPNILCDKAVVPECLQKDCSDAVLLSHVLSLLAKGPAFMRQRKHLSGLQEMLTRTVNNRAFGESVAAVVQEEATLLRDNPWPTDE